MSKMHKQIKDALITACGLHSLTVLTNSDDNKVDCNNCLKIIKGIKHPVWRCKSCFKLGGVRITRARLSKKGNYRLDYGCTRCGDRYQFQHRKGILNEVGDYLKKHNIEIEKYEDWSANNGNGKNKLKGEN